MQPSLEESSLSLRSAIVASQKGLVERESLVELIALAAVAGEHLLVIGPPGTAKSEAVRRTAKSLGGEYFEYLLGRFTEPGEVFGPVDLRRLREGTVEISTEGMLPEAEIAFLDEVFLGSTAILNTLLGILNERSFRRGHTRVQCPLRVCVAASNALPEEPALAAFADRFLVRVFLDPVPDAMLEDLLAGAWNLSEDAVPVASIACLDVLSRAARAADLAPVRPKLAQCLRTLRRAGVSLSDRRAARAQKLIAAAATLAGRAVPTERDLWPLIAAVPTRAEQDLARECLRELIAHSDNPALTSAAEDASAGPAARARRIQEHGDALLAGAPSGDAETVSAWKLRVESTLRELDAGFVKSALNPELSALRARLVAGLQER